MGGLLGFAPIYINGLLALLCVFVLPGLLFVRAFHIPSFPQRWFAVLLSSLAANHLFVTLIAAFQLDPLPTYRIALATLVAILILVTVMQPVGSRKPVDRAASIVLMSDIGWLLAALALACLVYINVWKYGVPHIFDDGDVAVSWNTWALLWAKTQFPTSRGYPQFIPTLWAVTYIFTGSIVQYFAYDIYIVLIIAPLLFNAMILGRINWWLPLVQGLAFAWFVAEIQESWLRSTLPQAFPDWVAAVCGFCGVVLFIANAPEGRLDREKMVSALLSLCLVSMAAATKPIFGLFAIAILLAICVDAVRSLQGRARYKLCIGAIGVVTLFAAAYAIDYSHLPSRGMPNYPVADLSERLWRAVRLLNANFTPPFKLLIMAGALLCPFVRRTRWLALPLWIGVFVWANTASYDLRNLLGLLMVSAFIPLFAAARAYDTRKAMPVGRSWRASDGAVAAIVVVIGAGLTLTLALGDNALKQRFADDQLRGGSGMEINRAIETVLRRGCSIFSATGYLRTISAFDPFRKQIDFFFFSLPLDEPLAKRFNDAPGCTSVFYPPDGTHPTILRFLDNFAGARGLATVIEGNGMVLMATPVARDGPVPENEVANE